MPDSPQIIRQWLLLRTVASRGDGATVKELANEAGVNLKTIRRDWLQLQSLGFPLAEKVSDHGRKHWRLDNEGRQIPLQFTWNEAAALAIARRLLDPLAGTLWWDGCQAAFRKIRASLGDSSLRYLDKLAAAFHDTAVGASDYSVHGEILDQLLIGVEDHRIAFITYRSLRSTEPVTTEVYPLGLVWHRNALYLVAHSVEHGEVRHYKLDRVSAVDLQALKFVRPKPFDLAAHLADTFGIHRTALAKPATIRIRFDRSVARNLEEKTWHPSQKLVIRRDGSLLAEFRLALPAPEFRSWILSWGSKARVIEPDSLATEIRKEIELLTQAYAIGPASTTDLPEPVSKPSRKKIRTNSRRSTEDSP